MAEPTDTTQRAQVLDWSFSGSPMLGVPKGSMSISPTQLSCSQVVQDQDPGIRVEKEHEFWNQPDWTLDVGLATL